MLLREARQLGRARCVGGRRGRAARERAAVLRFERAPLRRELVARSIRCAQQFRGVAPLVRCPRALRLFDLARLRVELRRCARRESGGVAQLRRVAPLLIGSQRFGGALEARRGGLLRRSHLLRRLGARRAARRAELECARRSSLLRRGDLPRRLCANRFERCSVLTLKLAPHMRLPHLSAPVHRRRRTRRPRERCSVLRVERRDLLCVVRRRLQQRSLHSLFDQSEPR